jgi:hypothetical protein
VKRILRTSSLSLAESLRLALEAEEIPAVVGNQNSAGIPPTAITVAVMDDADYERALAVLRSLEVPGPRLWVANRHQVRVLVAVIVAVAILVYLSF